MALAAPGETTTEQTMTISMTAQLLIAAILLAAAIYSFWEMRNGKDL
jgi:hypothetical protein